MQHYRTPRKWLIETARSPENLVRVKSLSAPPTVKQLVMWLIVQSVPRVANRNRPDTSAFHGAASRFQAQDSQPFP